MLELLVIISDRSIYMIAHWMILLESLPTLTCIEDGSVYISNNTKEGKLMKKKLIAILLVATMTLSLAACSDNGKEVESEKEVTTSEEGKTDDSEASEAETDDSNVGEVVEEDGIRKEPVITEKELNKTGETGPFKYTVEAIQISKLTATNDEMAEMLEIEKDKEVALVVMDVSVENTSDDTVYFYFYQATLTTNTKEQVETDMLLSDYIDGEYIGNVIHSGSIFYILKNSSADDITNISLHVDAPNDENFDSIGEEVKLDFEFK